MGLCFSSKLDWGSYIIYIAETHQRHWNLGSFFLLRLLCISVNLPLGLALNTVVIFGPVLLVANWNFLIHYKNEYVGRLLLHLLPLWTLGNPTYVFSIGITLVDVHLNWLNCFNFFILKEVLLIILIDCMIFLSPCLDVTRMSTVFSSHSYDVDFSTPRLLSFDLWSKWLKS